MWNIVFYSKRTPRGRIMVFYRSSGIIVCYRVIVAIDVLSKPDDPRQAVSNLRNGDVDFSLCKLSSNRLWLVDGFHILSSCSFS